MAEEEDDDSIWTIMDDMRPDNSSPHAGVLCGGCNVCGNDRVVADDGLNVCVACTSVNSRIIDMGAEWRFTGDDTGKLYADDPDRCGMQVNELLPRSSLGSVIGGVQGRGNRDMYRIRMYQQWHSMPYSERVLYAAFDKLVVCTANKGIPGKVIADAKMLYKRAGEQKLVNRGDSKRGLAAACVLYGCQMNHAPRPPKEVAAMFGIDVKVLTKGSSRLQELLQLTVDGTKSEDYITRFASKLGMSNEDICTCRSIAKQLDDLDVISNSAPASCASGILMFVCTQRGLTHTKKDVSGVCDVSEVTVAKLLKRIQACKHMLTQC